MDSPGTDRFADALETLPDLPDPPAEAAMEWIATKRVPSSVREMDPRVPWKEMAGMRDKLIHAYETVDVELVLNTVRERIPAVEPRVRALLDRLRESP